jgi:ABC-type phosphate transport system substrate-binding protein
MAMPQRTPWHRPLVALVTLLGLVLGMQALLAPDAGAAGFVPVSGSGSTWSSNALDHWRRGVSDLYGMAVNFSADGSTNGRDEFRAGQVDFAVSENPYGGSDGGVPQDFGIVELRGVSAR